MTADRNIRLPEVILKSGLSKSTIYESMREGTFPLQFKIGKRAVAWSEKDVLEWRNSKQSHERQE